MLWYVLTYINKLFIYAFATYICNIYMILLLWWWWYITILIKSDRSIWKCYIFWSKFIFQINRSKQQQRMYQRVIGKVHMYQMLFFFYLMNPFLKLSVVTSFFYWTHKGTQINYAQKTDMQINHQKVNFFK